VEQEDNRESTTKPSSVDKTTGEMTESSASNVESFEGNNKFCLKIIPKVPNVYKNQKLFLKLKKSIKLVLKI
jgi:hypothetical protein